MAFASIGDLSQHFQTLRHTGQVKSRLQTLTTEMSTGKKSDVAQSLRGHTGPLTTVRHEIAVIGDYRSNLTEISQTMTMMQNALEAVESLRSQQAGQTISLTTESSPPVVDALASNARGVFSDIVSNLNQRFGDKSLFAGAATDQTAFADGEAMLNDIAAGLGPTPTTVDIISAVDQWFNDPAGGFATMGYTGDQGKAPEALIGTNQTISVAVTGQDEGIKSILSAAAIGAMADYSGNSLPNATKAELLQQSGQNLIGAASEFNAMRSRLGASEAFAAEKTAEYEAQLTTLKIMYNDMTQTDPFETAVNLQEVQQQLETQFAITARLSGLTLANYL